MAASAFQCWTFARSQNRSTKLRMKLILPLTWRLNNPIGMLLNSFHLINAQIAEVTY